MKYPALSGQYVLEKTIGCGGFAKVKLATHILTGEKVAIKIMQKQSLMEDLPRVKHEITALKSLSHPNICKLYQVIETDSHYFLIMEYCCGGELFDHIVEKEKLNEDEARYFFRQVVSAVSYMHDEGFAHRDLKPENILLDRHQNLKLIDFGLSVKPEKGLSSHLYTSCGSPNYAAPELIKGEEYLGCEIDIWSLGVLLYALLCGSLPFDDNSIQKLYEKILFGQYEEKEWLSVESKMLLHSLLQVSARKRITTKELRVHPWLRKGYQNLKDRRAKNSIVRDEQCLKVLADYLKRSPDDLWKEISRKEYDYNMATYLLLLHKKKTTGLVSLVVTPPLAKPIAPLIKESQSDNLKAPIVTQSPNLRSRTRGISQKEQEPLAVKRSDENRLSGRRNGKRIRSPGILEKVGTDAKRMKKSKTPTPVKQNRFIASTPRSTKKILEGIERGFNRARNALTPRRTQMDDKQPAILWGKDLCNVSSTTSTSPQEVLYQLQQALTSKGIVCTLKGYTLRGKLKQQQNNKGKEEDHKLSFELEVCWLPAPSSTRTPTITSKDGEPPKGAVVGIRRKRLRGDAWIYKNICEEVLALTAC
ncbi:UNVERIFIED_CONTAM: hypothetical protein PYX00_005470 [Menopon gallinae]|uniref:non-specific serine/threonine protein kinase n=1 Tax=Menopon gallinae TaxID=328185 RepID=A0AAW2HRH7_9NEOP